MLTLESFAPLVGEQFSLHGASELAPMDDGPSLAPLPIALREARPLSGAPYAGRQPYVLMFEGPPDPLLPQHTYRLEHPLLGALDLFLVPIARDPSGVRYEAIFT